MGVNCVLKFAKCRDWIVGLPNGPKHRDAVEAELANLRQAAGGDAAERKHGGAAFARCARI
jgi:hypothetical protein